VNLGYPVGAVRPDDRQVGHPDVLVRAFLDQADPGDAAVVTRKAGTNLIEQSPIDFEYSNTISRLRGISIRWSSDF
jgi:hypothetical protein